MSIENNQPEYLENREIFPTKEEIESTFKELLKGVAYKVLRIKTERSKVTLFEIEITDKNGDKVEYNYQTATNDYTDPNLPPGGQFSASIHTYLYDKDGEACGGACVANYLNGNWKFY